MIEAMNKWMRYMFLPAAFMWCAAAGYTQEPALTKEITVETDFVPVEQKVTKLNILPEVKSTSVPAKTLSYSNWAGDTDIPYTINKFEPYGYNTRFVYSESRGYLDFGAGSQFNIVGSAGYKFLSTEQMTLRGWLQHSSTWKGKNTSPLANGNPSKQKFNDNIIGAGFTRKFDIGLLELDAYCHFDQFNYYGANENPDYDDLKNQTMTQFALKAGWKNRKPVKSLFDYSAKLAFSHFGFSKGAGNTGDGLCENRVYAEFGLNARFGSFVAGLDANGDYLSYSNAYLDDNEDENMGLLKISPYLLYNQGDFYIKGGVNLDMSSNAGASMKISPNVKAGYRVLDGVSVYTDVSGGKTLNRVSGYFAQNRYIAPNVILGSTYIPVDFTAGIKIGPFDGFHLRPFFGYGVFKDAMAFYIHGKEAAPGGVIQPMITPYTYMSGTDLKGWNAGVEFGYKYNDLVNLTFGMKYSPQDLDKGYFLGEDRAETVLKAQIEVKPLKPLRITLDFDWRSGRKCYSYYGMVGSPAVTSWGEQKLGNVTDLSMNAHYQIKKNIGVFIYAANLLNKQWDVSPGMGAQKVNLLAGVNIFF